MGLSEKEFLDATTGIIERARERNVPLRVLGALAVYIHSLDKKESQEAFRSLGRLGADKPLFTDLDLAAYGKQKKEITKLFQEMGFKPDEMVNALFGNSRLIYYHPQGKFSVDIFLNKLEFSHDVKFGEVPGSGRLELDYPTITLADIVLEKLQIHNINRKDLVDLIVLFMGHSIDGGSMSSSKEAIDARYVAQVLSNDWGFWYDAASNLEKVKSIAQDSVRDGKLSEGQFQTVCSRIDELTKIVEATPKSGDWLKRSKAGVKKKWYREVDEVVR